MTLHNNDDLFYRAIRETSDNTGIAFYFIEKDYWITLVLERLSESKYVDSVVFKGGTSLSKAFKLINRFSEDIDIALINTNMLIGNPLKTFIKSVEKEIVKDLTEIELEGITSKKSRFRKTVHEYPEFESSSAASDYIIIEINSFANPYPYMKLSIQSMIGEFLHSNNQIDLINKYRLEPFELLVLDKNRTLIEKIVSLIRFSLDNNHIDSIESKIRHFYDIYYLLNNTETYNYFNSEKFSVDVNELIEHDKEIFDDPLGWKDKSITTSPLINDFDTVWSKIKTTYIDELSSLAFVEIPNENEVYNSFMEVVKKLKISFKSS